MSVQQAHNFKTTYRDRTLGSLLRMHRDRPPGTRKAPERITLNVVPGTTPSGKPPVRIYVGTEAAQFRPERIFVWSIMQHRDPARVYEIHLMKDLVGFNRHNWKTGFTCYRYAIPSFAGGGGRAIYNDVDQIYLDDPAQLFDLDMQGKGMLGINENETSVMLLDCEKMSRIWRYEEALRGEKHKGFRASVHEANLWGPLPGVWNARDTEYVAGESKVLHFTTLQTQPWQPFPDELHYRPHHLAALWNGLDRDADRAGFTILSRQRPSQRFEELRLLHRTSRKQPVTTVTAVVSTLAAADQERVAALVREHDARTVCSHNAYGEPLDASFDGIVSIDQLQHLESDDIPWMLDELFEHARAFVYIAVPCFAAAETLSTGEDANVTQQQPHWWAEQLAAATRRHPGIRWVLVTQLSRRARRTAQSGPK